ncbi:MAG TPA: ketopantoate reductase family protein [Vicinamibacterales bacterium]|nr:ketopantoate reductase family protein [Vicinamibacterales bacterium]
MRIAIVGAGGVGGYFGGRLAEAGADVVFLARGPHLDALRTRGLRIVSPKGDAHITSVNATDDATAIRGADVVLFAVKLYDAEAAAQVLPQLVKSGSPETVVIPLQNGVEGIDIVSRAVGRDHTAGGTCYVSAVIAEPGTIRHTAMDHLIFGEIDRIRSPRLTSLFDTCRLASFQSTLSDDIQVDIWTKFVRLSVFSGMTAVTRSPIGVTVNDPDLFTMLQKAVAEGMAVAQARGVDVPSSTVDDVAKAYRALPPHAKASMLEDLERGRRLELPWLSGAVVRIGQEVGVPTPIHGFINAVLKPHVNGL